MKCNEIGRTQNKIIKEKKKLLKRKENSENEHERSISLEKKNEKRGLERIERKRGIGEVRRTVTKKENKTNRVR